MIILFEDATLGVEGEVIAQPKDNPALAAEPDCTVGLLKADIAAVVTCVMVLIKDAVVPAAPIPADDAGALFEIK